MPTLALQTRILGPVQVTGRTPGDRGPGSRLVLEAAFLILPGEFELIDDDGTRQRITVTVVFPSAATIRAEAQVSR